MKSNTSRNIMLVLLAFLGIGAIGGGIVFMISPDGKMMGIPLSILDQSPFNNFLIPGIILFLILGLGPVLLMIALLKKPDSKLAEGLNFFSDMHWAWSFTIYVGFALITWIQLQMMFIQAIHWLHSFYMFYAVTLIFTALMPTVRNIYKK